MQPLDPQPVPTTCVASVQMAPAIGEVAANVARSIELAEDAAGRGARLVVLPGWPTPASCSPVARKRTRCPTCNAGGPSSRAWIALAERLGIYLVAGIAERCGDRLYNSALIAGPQGYIGTYRKLHLWGDENLYFEAGDLGLPVFHTELGRLGVAICYDGWFPEVYRLLAGRRGPGRGAHEPGCPCRARRPTAPPWPRVDDRGRAQQRPDVWCAPTGVGVEREQPFVGRSLIRGFAGLDRGRAGQRRPGRGPGRRGRPEGRAPRATQLNTFNHVLRDRRRVMSTTSGWARRMRRRSVE